MGQAKQRGTFEQRKAVAEDRKNREQAAAPRRPTQKREPETYQKWAALPNRLAVAEIMGVLAAMRKM